MQFYKFSGAFTLILLGTCINENRASDITADKLIISNPVSADAKSALEKADKGKEAAAAVKSSDNKASKTKPTSVIEDRKPGTITIKPLAVNFSSLTFGMRKKSQLINGYPIDPYRSSFACLSNRGESIGTAYDLELGVMATTNIEAFTILGVSYERPFSKVSVVIQPGTTLAFDFNPRRSFEASLGGRYYWNTQKPWFPFVGLMGTVRFQDSISATVFNSTNNATVYSLLERLTLQKRKTLWGGTLQAGADYQFNDLVSLTLSVSLQYTPRASISYSSIGNRQIRCQDNRNLWNLPVVAALKLTL